MSEETYKMKAECQNCLEKWEAELLKGIEAKNQPQKCPYCGCETKTFYKIRF